MSDSPNLVLPYLADTQAQKHVTHNDALRILDALVLLSIKTFQNNTPPGTPAEGDRHLTGAAPTGEWTGQANKIAAYQDGAWRFFPLKPGWRVWSEPDAKLRAYNGTSWVEVYGTAIQNIALLGVDTTADAANPLSMRGANALFTAKYAGSGGSGDLSLKVNKETSADTVSVLFQTNFSGRAEIGLTGDDELSFKTSADGASFVTALKASTTRILIPMTAAATSTTSGALQVAGGAGVAGAVFAAEDCSFNGVMLGRGGGSVAANVRAGAGALASNTSGTENTAVGNNALTLNTTGSKNSAFGALALDSVVGGSNNTGIGYNCLHATTSGARNTGIGADCLIGNTTGQYNTAIGNLCMTGNTTGTYNSSFGYNTLGAATTSSFNTAVGAETLTANATGNSNTAVGYAALGVSASGSNNSALGRSAGTGSTSDSNCTFLGANTAVTGSNQVQLGDSATTTYVYGTVQNRSDARDKTDVRDTVFGLSFLERLRPVDFKWDMRDFYKSPPPVPPGVDATPDDLAGHRSAMAAWAAANRLTHLVKDGSRKRSRFHCGLIAQEVRNALSEAGQDCGVLQDHSIGGGDDALSLGYDQFIPMLIRAVQELSARVRVLEAR